MNAPMPPLTEVHVAHVDGAYRCYRVVAGRDRDYFGPRFGGPRLACQYADLAAGRPISPRPTPSRAAELVAPPPATPEEAQPLRSRPDVAATSHRASSKG